MHHNFMFKTLDFDKADIRWAKLQSPNKQSDVYFQFLSAHYPN